MLDPLTSLGVIANVVQLVDIGLRVTKKGYEIAQTGTTKDLEHLKTISDATTRTLWDLEKDRAVLDTSNGPNVLATTLQVIEDSSDPDPETTDGYGTPSSSRTRSNDRSSTTKLLRQTSKTAEMLSMMLSGLKLESDSATVQADAAQVQQTIPRKRKRDRLATFVKASWNDGELQLLRQQLLEMQLALVLELGVMESQKTSAILSSLGQLSRDLDARRDEQLSSFEKSLPQMIAQLNLGDGDEGKRLCSGVERLTSQARDIQTCQRIQHSLSFPEIFRREEAIVQAHANTFQWLFEDRSLGFRDWASHKNGLYWITGKPGSGKSTLMKYLVSNDTFSDLLKSWAGSEELVLAYHYFWNAGTPMQRSQAGLLRTLLFHIVAQNPKAAVHLVPPRFQQKPALGTMPWTISELCQTLELFAKKNNFTARLCFVIDGLDEYQDEQFDQVDLVELLATLNRCPSIKLCVSSRPWNVFRTAYDCKSDGQLEIQKLTSDDIFAYVSDTLDSSIWFSVLRQSEPEACTKLLDEIKRKAQGVFLWVRLVVRSLIKGLDNDDSIEQLGERLQEYPDTLDGYFQRMLDRIEKLYQQHSARIMLVALESEHPLDLRALPCLEWEIKDPDYALNMSIDRPIANTPSFCASVDKFKPLGSKSSTTNRRVSVPTSRKPFLKRWAPSNRYVDARCVELLEIAGNRVCFIHRTARDFLDQRKPQNHLRRLAGDEYDPCLSLARTSLSLTKMSGLAMDEVGDLFRNLLGAEKLVAPTSLQAFHGLLCGFEALGDCSIGAEEWPLDFSVKCTDRNDTFGDRKGPYRDSMISFQLSAAMSRLRGRIQSQQLARAESDAMVDHEGSDIGDFNILFGRVDGQWSMKNYSLARLPYSSSFRTSM